MLRSYGYSCGAHVNFFELDGSVKICGKTATRSYIAKADVRSSMAEHGPIYRCESHKITEAKWFQIWKEIPIEEAILNEFFNH